MYEENKDLDSPCTLTGFVWRIMFFISLLLLLLYIGSMLPA